MVPEPEQHEETPSKTMELSTNTAYKTKSGKGNSNNGHKPSSLLTQPEVDKILAETYLPRYRRGVCIWFTGLSGSGKSTTAKMLTWLLMEHGRWITVLNGEVVCSISPKA